MKTGRKIFGTDGIRGKVGTFPITVDFILKLGWAVGTELRKSGGTTALIGKDTRTSGYMIESALEAGLAAAGADILLLGPMPTSGIAYLTRTLRAHVGIVISASHNPHIDNGIKFFSSEGVKTNSSFEHAIEDLLDKQIKTADSGHLGKAQRLDDVHGRYIEFCKSSVPHNISLKNLKIVIDCANGATYHIAPHVFSELGANVISINSSPNGFNINVDCGSNHPEVVRQHVLKEKADLGIAFDGDGDRVVMVDSQGEILNGDELLYIIAKGLIASKRLSGGVVGTFMSNMGLELALNELGIHFLRVPVGDQNIIEELTKKNWHLGGESSGHIIYLPVTTTADGIITALQVLQSMQSCQMNLHELKRCIKKFPQRVTNVPDNGTHISLEHQEIVKIIKDAEIKLGKHSRILLRHSGTEPLIRVMVEGEDAALVDTVSKELVKVIKKLINAAVVG